VKKIHLQTAFTLGASQWQLIKTIYFPSVASKIIDDIRVLTAISWTYIIIAEMLNQTGGIGALIHLSGRQSRLDKVFALLIIIVVIGIVQDRLFAWLDKKFFKFKYQATPKN
jgi:NitT/TauT family transport system permease protein